MKIRRGYKTELDLNNRQRTACLKYAGVARWAYNWGLARKKAAYEAGERTPTAFDLQKELVRLKKTDHPWLCEVSKWISQMALRDLDKAFDNFFRRVKQKKGKSGYPKFKSRKRGVGSFTLGAPIHIFPHHIQLPRLGRLRLKEADYLPDESDTVHIFSATVSEYAGRWFVSIQVEETRPDPLPATGPVIGVDLGVKAMATCSNGQVFENPKPLGKAQKKLRRLQRQLCRRKKGSKNRNKTRQKIATLHFRIANIRKDALHKATTAIVAKAKPDSERPSAIVLEGLNISGMLKNHCLARAIADVGMFDFQEQIGYKGFWCGSAVIKANKFFPSSRLCSECGVINDVLTLSDRTWQCICGAIHDRDGNASMNLKRYGEFHRNQNACGEESLQAARPVPLGEAGIRHQILPLTDLNKF